MSRIIYTLLFYLSALPISGYSADDDSQKTYLITKEKLRCLYKQSDSLLKGPDPAIVFLSSRCTELQGQDEVGERTSFPVLEPKIDPNPTLKPEDVLMLSHDQLQCFKQAFDKLMMQTMEPISVRFTSNCAINDNYKP